MRLPRCQAGTPLLYAVPPSSDAVPPGSSSRLSEPGPFLYPFQLAPGGPHASFLTRIVAFTFYSTEPNANLTLGQVPKP